MLEHEMENKSVNNFWCIVRVVEHCISIFCKQLAYHRFKPYNTVNLINIQLKLSCMMETGAHGDIFHIIAYCDLNKHAFMIESLYILEKRTVKDKST